MNTIRSRWAAIGAAIAVTLGAGGIGITHATTDSSEGPVSAFFPIEPCRLIANAAITEDSSITLNGWGTTGDCELPDDITGLAANVTAVNATQQTNLRFYAQGGEVPETANLNPTPGAPATPNAVNITLNDTNGQFQVYNRFGTVGIFVDVMGYYDDHTHDDRYYTETEIDTALSDDVIPSGTTVTGYDQHYDDHVGSHILFLPVALPRNAPVALTDETVQFGPDATVSLNDDDEDTACTGSYLNPTAPAGMLCIYIDPLNDINTGVLYADVPTPTEVRNRHAQMRAVAAATGSTVRIIYTWAYTAP